MTEMTAPISGRVRDAIEFVRSNIGENAQITLRWDRTGASSLPLLGGESGQWTPENLFGRVGEFSAVAQNSKLPVPEASCGYRLIGDDIEVTPRFLIRGFGKTPKAVGSGGATGFGPMSILTVISLISGIWSLLHPSISVTLPGNMELTAVLSGDTVTVEFVRMPTIHAQMWFHLDLAVSGAIITPDNARITFDPAKNAGFFSRFIESRDVRFT